MNRSNGKFSKQIVTCVNKNNTNVNKNKCE